MQSNREWDWNSFTLDEKRKAKQHWFGVANYQPQLAQQPVHDSLASLVVISGGEGSGKSQTTSAEIAARFPTWQRVLFVCYKSESASNEADYLYEFLHGVKAARSYSKPKSGNIEILAKNGAVVESVSTYAEGERAVSGTGKSYSIIAMLEAGKQKYSVFLACLLRITRTGGLLILSGTIERSEPWFPDIIRKLQEDAKRRAEMDAEVVIIPTWENRILYPLGRDDPKIQMLENELGADLFNERCGGQPSVPANLIFKEFSYDTHVKEWCQYDPKYPVFVAVDPGYSGSHYSVNFIQEHPRPYTRQFDAGLPDAPLTDVFVIGDLYLDHAVHEEVIALAKELPWWSHIQSGVGDVVMKTHPMADRAPVDVWREKAGIFLRGQPVGIDDGIDRHHTFLKDPRTRMPRLFFNPSCTGIREYSLWKRKEVGEGIYGDPEKTNCDFTKALQYFLIDRFGRVEKSIRDNLSAGGERVTLDMAKTELPAIVGIAQRVPSGPVVRRPSNTYVVAERRGAKRIG